jgi:hypothetical protein
MHSAVPQCRCMIAVGHWWVSVQKFGIRYCAFCPCRCRVDRVVVRAQYFLGKKDNIEEQAIKVFALWL